MYNNPLLHGLRIVFSTFLLIVSIPLYAASSEAPGAILKLSAVVTTTTAKLNWIAPITPEAYPITDYIIQYKEQGILKFTLIKDGKNTETSYLLQNLNPDTSYNIRILAINSRGISPYKVFKLTTKKLPTPGVCGSMNNATTTVFPSGGALCKSGLPSVQDRVGEDGEYNWMCVGINSLRNENCQARVSQSTGAGGSPTQSTPRLLMANPKTYTGVAGKKVNVKLFWEVFTDRDVDYLQFMHLDNGQSSYSVDDHDFLYLWSNNTIADTRTVTLPENMPNGLYNILVGLSGINSSGDWINYPIQVGPGVTNDGDNRYKVGTLSVSETGTVPPPTPNPTPPPSYTYSWSTASWGTCSLSCGGGNQTRAVTCLRNDGSSVIDSYCSSAKPASSQPCNTVACAPAPTPTPTPTPTPSPNTLPTVKLASPQNSIGVAGTQETINLNWIRVPMANSYMQFMHLDNGVSSYSVDDHWVDTIHWTGNAVDTRTITIPSTIPPGKYDILVGLSGGNPWQNISLLAGNGVTHDEENRYKVGTIMINGTTPTPSPTPSPVPTPAPTPGTVSYSWNIGNWGVCSLSCGGGNQNRTVSCLRNDGTSVLDSFCSGTKPTTLQSCNTQACGTVGGQCSPITETPEPTGTVIYNGPGVIVPSYYGCWHDTGYVVNWAGGYYGPDPNFKVFSNTVRLYGMGGLEWNTTETSKGKYNWSNWDQALAKLRDTGVKTVVFNLYNVPDRLNRTGVGGGEWAMQWVPEDEVTTWLNVVKAKVTEYNMNLIVEVANEVFTPGVGPGSFWKGTVDELSLLSNYVLNWRNTYAPEVKVWSPSIPGFGSNQPGQDNIYAFMNWLRNYPRRNEFDAFSLHLYYLTADNLGKPSSNETNWTGFIEYRDALRAMGITKPIVDGEKGFGPGVVVPGTMFNYGVKSITQGISQTCYFFLGSQGNDETNLGRPYENAWAKSDIEDLARLAGRKITKVVQPNNSSNGRYWVKTDGQCYAGSAGSSIPPPTTTPPPTPTPSPTPTPTPTPNVLTTIHLASPQTYNAVAGNTKTLNLNWVRTPLGDSYLQFMHLDNGTTSFSVDDHMVDSTNWSGNAVDTRTINIPSSIPTGKYDILVGLSGGNPWQNILLNPGNGVTNMGNNRYKVGTMNITGVSPTPGPTPNPTPAPTPVPPVVGNGTAAGPRTSSFVNSGPIRATNGQVISGLRITSTSGPCIVVSGVSNVIIRDNDFTQCGNNADGTAVRIDGGSNNTLVEHNRISGNIGEGITVKYSPGNTVRKNVFAGIRDYGEKYRHGIEVSWSDRTTVTDNIFGEGSYPSDILSGYEISDSVFTGNEFINVTIIEPTGASFTIGDASDLDGSPANPGSNNYIARNMVRSQYGGVPAGVFGSTSNTILEKNCFSAGVQAYNYAGIFNGVTLRNNVINQGRSFYGGDSGRRDVPYIAGFDTNIDSTDCSRVP